MARWRRYLSKRATRRHLSRGGLVALNVALVAVVVAIVVLNPARTGTNSQVNSASTATADTVTQPLDQLASVNIALTVAGTVNLPEAGAVKELADSERIQLAVASTNNEVINKPQVVSSTFVSRKDIHTYVTVDGDTVTSIANKFGVSTDSVIWSNGLTSSSTLPAGKKLYIPPVNGIVYTVKSGDSPSTLAKTYRASESSIIATNDAELSALVPGEQILIPDGQIVAAPVIYSYSSGFAFGSNAIYGYNGYDWGNCTWYVASQIAVPANWGNAATWAAGARAAGWHVNSTPSVGAIAQNSWMAYGLGHVGIVDAVSADGKQVLIREMNGAGGVDGSGNRVYGGWNRVDIAWQPVSNYPNYITR